jgi:hypothetical protein
MALLIGFTDYTTQFVTVFYCRLHESVLQSFHYSRFWPPDVMCRGGLLMSSLFGGWLRTLCIRWLSATDYSLRLFLPHWLLLPYSLTICGWLTSVEIHILTDMRADRKQDTLVRGWYFNRNVFVITETSFHFEVAPWFPSLTLRCSENVPCLKETCCLGMDV